MIVHLTLYTQSDHQTDFYCKKLFVYYSLQLLPLPIFCCTRSKSNTNTTNPNSSPNPNFSPSPTLTNTKLMIYR